MPAGLQTWDESGNMIVDTTTIVSTFLGAVQLDANSAGSGTINHAQFTGRQIFFYLFLHTAQSWENQPVAEVVGNTIEWSFPTSLRPAATIIYGVR